MDLHDELKDREWQLLQHRIDQMFGKYLKDDLYVSNEKGGNIISLHEMPLGSLQKPLETA